MHQKIEKSSLVISLASQKLSSGEVACLAGRKCILISEKIDEFHPLGDMKNRLGYYPKKWIILMG